MKLYKIKIVNKRVNKRIKALKSRKWNNKNT